MVHLLFLVIGSLVGSIYCFKGDQDFAAIHDNTYFKIRWLDKKEGSQEDNPVIPKSTQMVS